MYPGLPSGRGTRIAQTPHPANGQLMQIEARWSYDGSVNATDIDNLRLSYVDDSGNPDENEEITVNGKACYLHEWATDYVMEHGEDEPSDCYDYYT